MYDESIQRALRRHKIRPITLPAPLRDELAAIFSGDAPVSHIITGTAGDGKTYHCREVWTALGGDAAAWDQGDKIQRLALDRRTLVIVKDLSELRDDESGALLGKFARDIADPEATTFYLLAANHGQLLEKLKAAPQDEALRRANKVVEDLLVTGKTDETGVALALTDLSRSPAAAMAMAIIDEVANHEGWRLPAGQRAALSACRRTAGPCVSDRHRASGRDPPGARWSVAA